VELERHRVELTGYCYRMLGSGFEAEDAVQETMVRAWRSFDRFDSTKSALRSWLYTIATNVCFDMVRSAQRRARAMDLHPASPAGAALGAPLPESVWVQPVPDRRVLADDPAAIATQRETIRLAFVAALQLLAPRQRAVLILRDVLCWTADEVAGLLATTVPSVNSALQRARKTLNDTDLRPAEPADDQQRELLARYATAFEEYDIQTLVSLLHEDATMSMPPFPWWLNGRDEIRTVLEAAGRPCDGSRLVPTRANGSPAFWQYRDDELFALVVLEIRDLMITEVTTFLDAPRLVPLFADEFPAAVPY
jgi:RNA polymerase sigma-70 factor, ECF subfamily